ncbi:sensor histidine kinase [Duganella sp. FT27W]|uniref:sensor histidine kinase n=1 Tax=Duganella sp. FT27W TaxID=2654636 RepID=UPI00186B95A9
MLNGMLKRDLSWLWAAIAAMVLLIIWLLLQLGRQGSQTQITAARTRAAVICQIMRAGAQRLDGKEAQAEAVERAVVDMALREDSGVEGGLWQAQRGVYAYAFPTYDGSGIKDDAPAAELPRIGSLAQRALASAAPVIEVRPGLREAVVYGACPVRDNVAGWTLTRVASMADNALDHLVVAVSVLLCSLVLAGAWFAVLLTRWGREVQRLSGLLVASERMAALGSLAAGLAHEIRNPLGTIRMKVDNALAAAPERRPVRTEAALHTTLLQVQRLETLVASLLALTQPFHPQRAPVVLADWLEQRRQDHADAAADLSVTLALKLGPGLGAAVNHVVTVQAGTHAACSDAAAANADIAAVHAGRDPGAAAHAGTHAAPPDSVAAEVAAAHANGGPGARSAVHTDQEVALFDPAQMARVLDNLLINALAHTTAGGHVELGAARNGDVLRLWVADDGRGVPPALQASLFDPLVTGRPGGTGLGLAVVREVVHAHGGTVALDPAHVPGTRIVMDLPWT